MSEEWRQCLGGTCEVSSEGHVRTAGTSILRRMRPDVQTGYYRVTARDGVAPKKPHYVHRLVAEAFLDKPFSGCEVNHRNGVKTDNRAENLEWVSSSENKKHAYRLGLIRRPDHRGEAHPSARLTESAVRSIRRRHEAGESRAALARELGLHRTTVSKICNRRLWPHVQ